MPERVARAPHAPARRRRCSPWPRSTGPTAAATARRCCALALEALERGALIERENGVFSISPILTLALADRDDAIAWWDASLEAAHRNGSLFAVASMHLFYGMTLLWRGDLAGAAEMLAEGQDEFTLVGLRRDRARSTSTPTCAGSRSSAATSAGARAALEQSAPRPTGSSDDVRYRLGAEHELLIAEGRLEEALAVSDELERAFGAYVSPVAGRWRSHRALVLDRLGRRDEALALVGLRARARARAGARRA